MLERLKNAFAHQRALHEIEALTSRDLDDIGLTRPELEKLVATPDHVTARQQEMARHFGLSTRELSGHPHDLAVVVETCKSCSATSECHHYLADPARSADDANFCPNAAIYRDLSTGV